MYALINPSQNIRQSMRGGGGIEGILFFFRISNSLNFKKLRGGFKIF